MTGFTLFKVGKATAAAIGSGIFILQIANHNGYININWDKLFKRAEELSERIDDRSSKPNLVQKVSKFSQNDLMESYLHSSILSASLWV